MAITTTEQRRSVLGIVTPNTDKDENWRRQVAGFYSFEESEVPPPPDPVDVGTAHYALLNMGMGMRM